MQTNFTTLYVLCFSLLIFSFGKTTAQTGNWKLAGNNLAGTEKIGSLNNFDLKIVTNNATRMTIKPNGRVGIGTTSPEAKLHVFKGSAGSVSADSNAPFVVENSNHNYINLLAPGTNERGILFGDDLNADDGGIVYIGSNNSMQFRTNGNITRMSLSDLDNPSIGFLQPDFDDIREVMETFHIIK